MLKTITAVGLDPAFRNFGMAKTRISLSQNPDIIDYPLLELIETSKGKIKTIRTNSDDLRRSKELFNGLNPFIKDVDIIFVEIPVGSQTARAMASYGISIGLLASIDVPLIQLTAYEIKKACTGNKNASKQEMIDWAVAMYPESNWITNRRRGLDVVSKKNEHLADALGAIYAGMLTDEFKQFSNFRS